MARAFSAVVALSVLFCLAYGEDECQGKTGMVRYKSPESDHEFLFLCKASGATLLGCFDQDGRLLEPGSVFPWFDETGILGVDYACREAKIDGSWLTVVGCRARNEGRLNFERQYRPFYRHPELAFHCRKTEDGPAFQPLAEACASGADPEACGCGEEEFACPSLAGEGPPPGYTCLPKDLRCNGINDCLNWADEVNCTACSEETAFFCGASEPGRNCIPNYYRCNGGRDCGNGADEENCDCSPDTLNCFEGDGGTRRECYPPSVRCNGMRNCGNGADEANCTSCAGDAFYCGPNTTRRSCIAPYERCDGMDDCDDGSDEKECESVPCPAGGFQCGEGARQRCVPARYRCDGDNDCGNGADEEGCDASPPPSR